MIGDIILGVKDGLFGTAKEVVNNAEAVTILSLAAVGTTKVLSDLPFQIAVPMVVEGWIASPALLPVLSVLLIIGLVLLMKWRLNL